MTWLIKTLNSSIGKKWLVGISGLALVGFLVTHIIGNSNLIFGEDAFNGYAHALHSIPGLPVIQYGLLAVFLLHIGLSIRVSMENKKARGQGYAVSGSKRKSGNGLAAKMMPISGIIVLAFLLVHVSDFSLKKGSITNLYETVTTTMAVPWRTALYVAGSLLVGWHMSHGIQSAFRSLGANHPKYTPFIAQAGVALSILMGIAFASLPLLAAFGVIGN